MWKPPSALAALAAFAVAALAAALAPPAQAALIAVKVATPTAGSTVHGNVVWEATVTSGSASRVDFLIDGQQRWVERGAPYRFNGDAGALDTTTLANGSHVLSVRAVARNGRRATASVTVNVNNLPPLRVAILSPTSDTSLTGAATWEAAVTSGTATQVEFLIDGQTRWVERTAPYRFNGDDGTLDTRTLANGTHTLATRATSADGQVAHAAATVRVANNRVLYCFGDPAYGANGWQWDGTSTGWIRQAPDGIRDTRVTFDSSVPVMSGCPTVKAEVQPLDPILWGGRRAQLYTDDGLLQKYGSQQPLGTAPGSSNWWGFAFATGAGYRPQSALPYPNWNAIFTWHDTGCGAGCSAPQANIGLSVATAEPDGAGGWRFLPSPKLELFVAGGDPADPNWWSSSRRWFVGDFVPGKRYRIEMGVKWGANGDGEIELWIDGVQRVARTRVSNLWWGQNVYPVFENYRAPTSTVTWTNTVYYGGLVKGASRADVALP